MYSHLYKNFVWIVCGLCLASCIGTDFLEETAELVDPRVTISPEVTAVEIGNNATFEAVYYDSTDTPVNTTFSWQSSDAGIATVDNAGIVTGVSTGQARIWATAQGVSSEQALVTVVSDPNQIAFVDVTPGDTSLTVGKLIQFTATTRNAEGNTLDGKTITWATSDNAIAVVNATGLVTGLSPGSVQITATSENIESTPINLEVLEPSRTGTFRATPGTSYTVKGTAILEQIPGEDGLRLRFDEDFQSSNGPDLYVYLSKTDKVNATSVSLGKLQTTLGAQTYTVPSSVNMTDFDYVLIHCLPFNVTFGFAAF